MTAPLPVSRPWGLGSGNNGGRGVILPPNVAAARAGGDITRSLEIPLPEVFPIPDAKEFNIEGSIASVGASNNTLITGTSFVIPTGNLARISGLALYITNMLVTTNVVWSLVSNGQALPGYQNVAMFPRPAAFVSNAFDVFLRVRGEVTLSVIFSNLDGGTYVVGAAFSGWFWPETSDTRWKSAGE